MTDKPNKPDLRDTGTTDASRLAEREIGETPFAGVEKAPLGPTGIKQATVEKNVS